MRLARSNDTWRKLFLRRDQSIAELSFDYSDVSSAGSGSLRLLTPFTLLCGENGAGKTSLLCLIHRALLEGTADWNDKKQQLPKLVLTGSITNLCVRVRGIHGEIECKDQSKLQATLAELPASPEITFIDTANLAPRIVGAIRRDANFGDLIDGIAPRILSGSALEDVSALVGRDYESVSILEISDYDDFERLPYFRVKSNGVVYGSESMGLGELALFYLYWAVTDAPSGSILLIEEPESFIAPRSQRFFIDWLAEAGLTKRLFVVVSTHSGSIAERLPPDGVVLCTRGPNGVLTECNPPAHLLVDRLHLLSHRRCIVLVEDKAAEACGKALLAELDPRLSTECDFGIAGSDGAIDSALLALPQIDTKRFAVVGLYDGDQRDESRKAAFWPRLYLPGNAGPEVLLKRAINAAPDDAANRLGVTSTKLQTALGGAAGKDPHDWLTDVCKSLEINVEFIFRRLAPILVRENPVDSREFVRSMQAAARRPS